MHGGRACEIRDVHVRFGTGGWEPVRPHLVTGGRHLGRVPTKHSLKTCKISAYVALRLHPDYAVEPRGAHAGSTLERMSVSGMEGMVRELRPKGLGVALRYARGALGVSVAEVDRMVFETMQKWVADVGVSKLPREDSWASVTAFTERCLVPAADPEIAEICMREEVEVEVDWDLEEE